MKETPTWGLVRPERWWLANFSKAVASLRTADEYRLTDTDARDPIPRRGPEHDKDVTENQSLFPHNYEDRSERDDGRAE